MAVVLATGRSAAQFELRVASLILGSVVSLCWLAIAYVERRRP